MNTGAAVSTLKLSASDGGLSDLIGPEARSRYLSIAKSVLSVPLGITMPAHDANKLSALSSGGSSHQQVQVAEPDLAIDRTAGAPAELSSADQDRISVQAALRGDQTAFGDLVTRYQSAVYNMAYRMLGDPTEAEDAAQEVFVRAWNQLHTFQLDRRFSTWLLSIASHHCIDVLRRRRPTAPLDDVALYVESEEPAPDEIALQGEQRDIVKRLLNTLPDKYRSVTVLRYYNDLSYDEIARLTGLTESAVKTQLHRARRMLAEELMKSKVVGVEAPARSQAEPANSRKGGASYGV
jgi:RNA polymerase sigma-70 factor (ECF subfamily)